MIVPPIVTVIIDERPVVAPEQALLIAGIVSAPIDPYARLVATRVTIDDREGTVTFERGALKVTLKLPLVRDASARIPLGLIARALGECVRYDAPTHTLAIDVPPLPLATMTPYAPWTPPPGPLPTFTPEPAAATPRPTVSNSPQPRRTPIALTNGL